ncbi:universal stress protein [Natribaculum luteum]|uniref:Universal stress protein n=1 Tax=Natribaculum luteum TaxID=1586232 RepID=A0ABD5P1U7_9EURY|nr:universal stress protein [Natribaculum luteum]
MFDHILVPTDGSGPATAALEYAAAIAAANDATVHVLHVTETPPDEEDEEIVTTARDWVTAAGAAVDEEVVQGEPDETICEYAADRGVDGIVMGTQGRQGLERFVLGSVTESVVRNATVPVLVVRRGSDVRREYPYETIVVPIDGSEHAVAALEHGIEIATRHDATLHLLSVVDVRATGVDAVADLQADQFAEYARTIVDDAAAKARTAGVDDVVTTVTFGSTYREIRSHAQDHEADLLVMGTHGRHGFDRLMLGSVTERVLRTAPAPVLTVRVPETE